MDTLGAGWRRTTTVAVTAFSLALIAGPAVAARPPVHTTITAQLTPATVLVRSSATVAGTVSPAGGSVALERLVGARWQAVAHQAVTHGGGYDFVVRAPKSATTWTLKVVRTASKSAKAGSSVSQHLRVVTKQFVVAAASASTVTAPAASAVTGVVVPAVKGTVQVQRQVGKTWAIAGTGKLGAGGAFSVSTTLPIGVQRLRVVKPYTASIAQGISQAFSVIVSPADGPTGTAAPTVTTAALPAARVGVPYAVELTATGGGGFYTWSGSGLPGGFTLSSAGLLAGTPTAQGTSSLTVTVTDGAGHSASSALSLTEAPPAGQLFAVGGNPVGELGNGSTDSSAFPTPVNGMTSVVAAAVNGGSAAAVTADGSVWAWGENVFGELGNGTNTGSAVPLRVPALSGMTAVAAVGLSFLALKNDGTVWAWGGTPEGTPSTPAQVQGLSSVVAIAGTNATGIAVRSDGSVWSWGSNGGFSLLGNGNPDGSAPAPIPGLTNITAVVAGNTSVYALQTGGAVFAWGNNASGRLGDNTATMRPTPVLVHSLPPAAQIVAGFSSAYALTTDGRVFGWGTNDDGELGVGTTISSLFPQQVENLTGVKAVGAAGSTAYAVASGGTVSAWGLGNVGQLGDGGTTNEHAPVPMAGISTAFALGTGNNAQTELIIAH